MASATSALNYALSYVGTKESPANSNRGSQIDKWQRAVGMIGQPWCGAFVFAALEHGGVEGLSPRMRYVPYIVDDAHKGVNGLVGIVDWEDKKPGDLVIYNWDGGVPDHVGLLVATVNSTTILSVEGNTAIGNDSNGGEVMRRTREKRFVQCIIRPRYPKTPVPLTPCEWPGITLRRGSKGSLVKVVQGWINTLDKAGYKYDHLTVDGDFGVKTETAVRLYQSRHKLEVDGVVGPKTYRALCSSVRAHQDDKGHDKEGKK